MAAASVTTEPKHEAEDASSATAELERRKKIEAKMFKNQRRHYKKDTRYVLDLYTLTFDEDETVESVGEFGIVFASHSAALNLRSRPVQEEDNASKQMFKKYMKI